MGLTHLDPPRPKSDTEGWECRERLNKLEAERLLDWLEANGYAQREVSFIEDHGFTVRWRRTT
jgi:hypothetical protein